MSGPESVLFWFGVGVALFVAAVALDCWLGDPYHLKQHDEEGEEK